MTTLLFFRWHHGHRLCTFRPDIRLGNILCDLTFCAYTAGDDAMMPLAISSPLGKHLLPGWISRLRATTTFGRRAQALVKTAAWQRATT
jgi:hypothetical protein